MGVVYAGNDPLLKRKVAIKTVLPPNQSAELSWDVLVQRLAREAQAAAVLNHPNIIAVYDVVPVDKMFCVVMEFVNGKSVSDLAPLGLIASSEFAVRIVREAAAALDHAHSRGVIHRDVKPSNIIVNEAGVAKLADFGIAKMLGSATDLTQNVALGTVEYMSPEQVNMKQVDGRADQYSLGVMAYGLLTGSRIYDADTVGAWLANLMTQPVPAATSRNATLPAAVDAVFARVLAKTPGERYESCTAFANDLAQVLLGMSATQAFPQLRPSSGEVRPPLPPPLAVGSGGAAGANTVVMPATVRKKSPWVWIAGAVAALVLAGGGTWMMLNRSLPEALKMTSGDMVLVQKGDALLGQNPHPVYLPAFYIDKTEVSNKSYLEFCRATGRVPPVGLVEQDPSLPVVNVTYDDATSFAKWAGKRLPTGLEWERAARGTRGLVYPWGNELRYDLMNLPEPPNTSTAGLKPADSLPNGASPVGAVNMLGNVWEWTATPVAPDALRAEDLTHLVPGISPPLSIHEAYYQIRGGSYTSPIPRPQVPDLIWDSSPMPARVGQPALGFRCAKDP